MLQSMGADKRVVFPQTYAPVDRTLAEAIVKLGTALAKGDAAGMEGLLTPEARTALASLKASGEWETATAKLEGLRVVMMTETPGAERATSSEVLLQTALQEPGKAYVLGWRGKKNGDLWLFEGADASRETRSRAADFDGGAAAYAGTAGSSPDADARMNQLMIVAWTLGELNKRIVGATGRDLAAEQLAQLGMGNSAELQARMASFDEQAKRMIESGIEISDETLGRIVMGGKAAAASTGGAVTEEQVIQWIAEILRLPIDRVRAAGGAMPTIPGSGMPGGPRPGRGIAPAGG